MALNQDNTSSDKDQAQESPNPVETPQNSDEESDTPTPAPFDEHKRMRESLIRESDESYPPADTL